MVILVTGGSGFIGSHVVDKLVETGYSVRVFDIKHPHRNDVEWFNGDLLNDKDVMSACRDVDFIFHLAAVADVNIALFNPELCVKINELGTLNLLKAATAMEVDRVILASTTWVYGKAQGIMSEDTAISSPDHIYTKTKIGQEHLMYSWNIHYNLPYTILRYGIPYGPRMRSNMAIAVFTKRAMEKNPITIFGDGDQGRCFIYVEDLAEGHKSALKISAENQVFNIAGKEFVTINRIVECLEEIFGHIKIIHQPLRPGDFKGVKISIDKAQRVLGWKPKIDFKKGLTKLINWIQKPVIDTSLSQVC